MNSHVPLGIPFLLKFIVVALSQGTNESRLAEDVDVLNLKLVSELGSLHSMQNSVRVGMDGRFVLGRSIWRVLDLRYIFGRLNRFAFLPYEMCLQERFEV